MKKFFILAFFSLFVLTNVVCKPFEPQSKYTEDEDIIVYNTGSKKCRDYIKIKNNTDEEVFLNIKSGNKIFDYEIKLRPRFSGQIDTFYNENYDRFDKFYFISNKKITSYTATIRMNDLTFEINSVSPKNEVAKNNDGIFTIKNRDENNNAVMKGLHIINNTYQIPSMLIFGDKEDGKSERIVVDSRSLSNKEFEVLNNFDKYKNVFITTINGKMTNAHVRKDSGIFYVVINEFDTSLLPSLLVDAQNKAEQKKKLSKEESEKKDLQFSIDSAARGEKLYKEKVEKLIDKSIPIFISAYSIKMDSANGIDISIDFENISDKTIKYVDFEVTPYNRVDDIAYSEIDHSSKKTIQFVDYVEPFFRKNSSWRGVWYNPTISYIKINSVKVTFKDNTSVTIPQSKIDKVFKVAELVYEKKLSNDDILKISYSRGKNEVLLGYGYTDRKERYRRLSLKCFIEADTNITGTLFEKTRYNYEKSSFDVVQNMGLFWLEDKILADGNGHFYLAAAKSGYIEHKDTNFHYDFTTEELQFLRDCICIWYYVEHPYGY